MKIMPIDISQKKQPAFQSCFRIYPSKTIKNFDIFGRDTIRTSTNLFREDIDWFGLVKYMENHFKDKDKVNILSLACSDGSEAYTMAISILECLPENIQSKFLPIYASDIDKEVLKAAKSGRINIHTIEFLSPEKIYDCKIDNYFKQRAVSLLIKGDDVSETDTISSYQPVQKLMNAVKFKKADILAELKNLNDNGNSVVLCRNVFPYLSSNYIDNVIKTAQKRLKRGCLFIIGDYDAKVDMEQKLLANGFCQPLINSKFDYGNNVFKRM